MNSKETSRQTWFNSIKELTSVLSGENEINFPEGSIPLFQACQILGQASNLKFACPSNQPVNLESICSASNIRYRRVVLNNAWWKLNRGHLLGFLKDNHQPIVLFKQKKHYSIINPATHEIVPLNHETFSLLELNAFVFYQSLPQKITGLKDIASFCLKGTLGDYLTLGLVSIIAVILSFLVPFANKILFDYVIPNYNLPLFVQVLIALSIGALSSGIFLFFRSLFTLKLSGSLEHRLQMGLWDRLFQLPVQFFKKMGLGDLISRTLIIDLIRRNLSENTLLILFNAVFSILYFIMMLIYSWQLSLIGLGMALIALLISVALSLVKLKYDRALLASYAGINTFLTQAVNGITKIRSAFMENKIFSIWASAYKENQSLTLKAKFYQLAIGTSNKMFNLLITFAIYAVIIWWLYSESTRSVLRITPVISVGTFLAFSASLNPFLQAIMDIGNNLTTLMSFVPFWERARPLLLTDIEDTEGKASPEQLAGSCRLENVSFRYHPNNPLALDNINMDISPGAFIGIVGPSGSGKSTLLQLLMGFESPEKGSITYDKYDLNRLNIKWLRQNIGIVTQNSAIFFGTLFDNIVCGKEYPPPQIWEAIKLSLLEEELAELPMGMHTLLPAGGITLSGGQRQKIILARCLIRQPKIILLDEATSSLDNKSQQLITDNLSNFNATRIVIAHRFSTIKNADTIYVMEQGRIVSSGTFEELLSSNEWFKYNYSMQM